MPMDRSRYPENWDEIATAIKEEVRWRCESCGRPCRQPNEDWFIFYVRVIESEWTPPTEELISHTGLPRPGRFVLTVAHLDHVPENCDRSNLRAWCKPCHCRYDLSQMARKKMLTLERVGQLRIDGV